MEPIVLIERQSNRASTGKVVELRPRDRAAIGSCSTGEHSYDVDLGETMAHVLVTVFVQDDHWKIYNTGNAPIILENAAQLCEYLIVEPGTQGRVVPYDVTRLRDAYTNHLIALVTAVFQESPPDLPAPCADTAKPLPVDRIARDTKHFAVLTELCRPRLLHGPGVPLPSSADIAGSIQRSGRPVTPRAVDSQIDYLLEKLGAPLNGDRPTGAGRGWKRELLATEAVRRGIITQADVRA